MLSGFFTSVSQKRLVGEKFSLHSFSRCYRLYTVISKGHLIGMLLLYIPSYFMFSLSLDVFSFICVYNSTLDAWLDVYILVLRSALDNIKAISF